MILLYVVIVVLALYIARKAQQCERLLLHRPATPWWYELGDFVNRFRPGTF